MRLTAFEAVLNRNISASTRARELCRSVNASRDWLEENGTELYRYGR